jgi:hypothetical protein
MGVRNYLIEGVSGAGKTTVAEALQRRGCHVVHGDRELAYCGDPETGEPLVGLSRTSVENITWAYERWIWNLDKVRSMVADHSHAQSFFCGGSRNSHRFIDVFDEVFVLEADLNTLKRRVRGRGEDEFGGKPEQWALLVRVHASKAGLPRDAVTIDSTRPVDRIVDDILSRCAEAGQETARGRSADQSRRRGAPSGRNVGQANHVLVHPVAGGQVERRTGAGEEGRAAAEDDGVEVKAVFVDQAALGEARGQDGSADVDFPGEGSFQPARDSLEVIGDESGVGADGRQRT